MNVNTKINKTLLFLVCIIGLNLPLQARSEELKIYDSPLITVKTNKTMAQVLKDLNQAIVSNNYDFIRQQTIDSRLKTVSTENKHVILVYFCNFSMLNRALRMNSHIGVFVPCKITLIQKKDHIEMVAINPRFLTRQFNNDKLSKLCNRLAKDYHKILEEATI
jgi:cytochrome c oxidase cbb3-type subunit 3